MIARSAPSPSSPAPSARRCAALGPDCSARPSKRGDRAANAYLTTLASTEDTRSSDSVRQVGYWFPHVTVAGLSLLSPAFWSSVAWGQQSRIELPQVQTEPRTRPPRANPIVQPKPVQPSPPNLAPVALPVTDPNSPLGSALASCDKDSESSESLALAGTQGEVKLDRCFRGRNHLVCVLNALRTEATATA